jgi:hypothetical protein
MTDKETNKRSSNLVFRVFDIFQKIVGRLFGPKNKLIGTSWRHVKLEISPEVNRYLEMRHVLEDEIKQVIFHAETTGDKLYQPDANRYLGKLRIGKATFYADYSYGEKALIVNLAYAHRSEIVR